MILLDTDVCVAFLRGRDAPVRDRLLELPPAEVFLCSVVKAELWVGARRSARVAENLRTLEAFFEPIASLPFDDEAAARYGSIRAQLEREGRSIGGNDTLIAAIALAADATLVTRNADEFRRVPGLRLEVW